MAKPNKKKISDALREWQALQIKLAQNATWRDELIAPLKAEFDKAAAPLIQAADAQAKPLLARSKELQTEIEKALLEGVGEDGVAVLPQVAVEGALAEVTSSVTRTIAPKDFLEAVPEGSRDGKFFECLSVLITKVDKHFGTQFERLIEKVAKPRVTIRLVEAEAKPKEKLAKAA
ncbi:MAG TPA: hypothetical protein PLD20_00885 [Blastocatellia bacterium]|nr:hypothetical protein [Blastocatellia bacterium]HMX24017.1 hypothetical protein [Blastocatellia bacterium]HMY70701.1 hypothetical protein [Blastocatellia bacterium]HMZ16490.1 hypothetical protein [Blastocatellia bacterium]HNG29461.1 hypothetical protein [Blastocatellia bacterium]